MKMLLWSGAAAILLGVPALRGAVTLNGMFSDHMILQAGMAVPIWGTADPHEKVTVKFAGQSSDAEADATGKWMVKLEPLSINSKPDALTVIGSNTITVSDVLVGEVWLASGQSNMGFSLNGASNAATVLPEATDDQLRFFNVKNKTAGEPQTVISGGSWVASTPDTAKGFSAVAYFFAREIRTKKNCPVGIIQASWGGTPLQIWMSLDGVKRDPPMAKTLEKWNEAQAKYQAFKANPQMAVDYAAADKKWLAEVKPAYDDAVKQYDADKAAGKPVGAKPLPSQPEPDNPNPMGMTPVAKRPHTPTVAYNAMLAPLIPYAIRGALWYQGEDNGSAGLEYRDLLPRFIEDWRGHWGYDFPFLIVQLPCCGHDKTPVAASGWPWLREAQLMALREPKTGMAITIDVGDPANVHPADKIDVGQRLALIARNLAYGESIEASGPLYKNYVVDGSQISVVFTETGGGLMIGQAPWRPGGVDPLPTDHLIGFYIAGADKQWFEADARIGSDSVIVSSPKVSNPVAVRYGWASSPRCNLYNKEGLPASPFRTDNW